MKSLRQAAPQVTLKGYLVIVPVLSVLYMSIYASSGLTLCLFRPFLHTPIRCTWGWAKIHYKGENSIVGFTCWSPSELLKWKEQRNYYKRGENVLAVWEGMHWQRKWKDFPLLLKCVGRGSQNHQDGRFSIIIPPGRWLQDDSLFTCAFLCAGAE